MPEWYECIHCFEALIYADDAWRVIKTQETNCEPSPDDHHHLNEGGGSELLRRTLSTFRTDPSVVKRMRQRRSVDTAPPRSRSRSTSGQPNESPESPDAQHRYGDGNMALTGTQVREQREKLGWKRPLLSEKSGLTIAQIAGIETGRALKDGEEEKLRAALSLGAEEQVNPNGTVSAPKERLPLPVEENSMVFTGENPEYSDKLDAVRDGNAVEAES